MGVRLRRAVEGDMEVMPFLRGILHLGLHVLFRIREPDVARKCLFCLVKSLNWLPISLSSSCISGLGGMTDFGPLIKDHCVCPGIMSFKKVARVCVCVCVCVFWLRMACRHPSVLGGKVSAAFSNSARSHLQFREVGNPWVARGKVL